MEEFLVDEELEERSAGWVGLSTIEEFELEFEQYDRKRMRLVTTEPEGGDAKLVTNDGLLVEGDELPLCLGAGLFHAEFNSQAVLGIENRTSCNISDSRTTRPNSQ